MPTVNIKDIPKSKIVKLVDLSEDSINKIAEAVAKKIADPVKHGHWLKNDNRYCECSECHAEGNMSGNDYYCRNCGAKMDEVTE